MWKYPSDGKLPVGWFGSNKYVQCSSGSGDVILLPLLFLKIDWGCAVVKCHANAARLSFIQNAVLLCVGVGTRTRLRCR